MSGVMVDRSNIILNDSARTLGSDGSWAIKEGNLEDIDTVSVYFMKSQICLQ